MSAAAATRAPIAPSHLQTVATPPPGLVDVNAQQAVTLRQYAPPTQALAAREVSRSAASARVDVPPVDGSTAEAPTHPELVKPYREKIGLPALDRMKMCLR